MQKIRMCSFFNIMHCKPKPWECVYVGGLGGRASANTTQAMVRASLASTGLCGSVWQRPLMTCQELTFIHQELQPSVCQPPLAKQKGKALPQFASKPSPEA